MNYAEVSLISTASGSQLPKITGVMTPSDPPRASRDAFQVFTIAALAPKFHGTLAFPHESHRTKPMPKPPLDPDVDDAAPEADGLTPYDGEHLVTYLRLLDAEGVRRIVVTTDEPKRVRKE